MLNYVNTRDKNEKLSASQAILKGLGNAGGLFVPEQMPKFDKSLEDMAKHDYRELAYEVMKLFFDDFTEEELKNCIKNAYGDNFDDKLIAPLHHAGGASYIELFHGPTIAFKDMALQILPHLMLTSARKQNNDKDIVILTATSGDTGKAALAGFAGVDGTKIIVFYPKDGVSKVQKAQMVTQTGDNTLVVGIDANFDEAQTAVKTMFTSAELNKKLADNGYMFSSANSINIGRLIPQVVYYVYSYLNLCNEDRIKIGDNINIVVPTGNFGNILAASYAMRLGLPVSKLIVASNDNKVLFDFFNTGVYDTNREFILTSSPSMDILISSNLERLIYHIAGEDVEKNKSFMDSLKSSGKYEIDDDMKAKLDAYYAGYATEEEVSKKIASLFKSDSYIIDTHTGVAAAVYDKYVNETGDKTPTIIASTASPYKFPKDVLSSIDDKYTSIDDFDLAKELEKISGVSIPKAVKDLKIAPVIHKKQIASSDIQNTVEEFLGL